MTNDRVKYSLIIGLIGAVFFISFLGGVHLFDWDEINFAEISREMLLTEEYTRVYVDFLPFWEKPPLFFWLQSSAMSLFGIGEFAARLPNAICGIFTLIILFNIGKTLYNTRFGLIWAGVYFGSVLPHLYFKSGIIDPWFNLFIFCGLYYFILFHWKKNGYQGVDLAKSKWSYLFWGGFIIGLGILTKGQVAYLIAGLTMFVYWVYQRFRFYVNVPEFLFFTFAATLVTLSWYGIETWKNGPWFIEEFNKYQYRLFSTPDAGHKGFAGYHFFVLLFGCFPAAIFTIRSFFKIPVDESKAQADFAMWMKMLFWVVLILFSIVKSKIVHYSSMCYFPLTYLAAVSIYYILENKISFNKWIKTGLIITGGTYILAVIALPIVGNNIDVLKSLFNDPFAVANMDAEVNWTGFEAFPGIFLLGIIIASFYFINKNQSIKGFATLFGGTAIFIHLVLFTSINKIEHYSQRAAIEFFKSKVGEDCYVKPYGYKSYGHLFYTQKPPVTNEKSYDWNWLVSDEADKPVYIITKIHREVQFVKENPNFDKIGSKNGFIFFKKSS
jgi:4-amino-4-deoxy-L-arabinose transferase-like glycosyltransferase